MDLAAQIEPLIQGSVQADDLRKLIEHIEGYDFTAALGVLDSLLGQSDRL